MNDVHILVCDEITKLAWLDHELLDPAESQALVNHSPDGFNWGYGGSGPAQLALAIMLKLYPDTCLAMYQGFKEQVIAQLPKSTVAANFWFESLKNKWMWLDIKMK